MGIREKKEAYFIDTNAFMYAGRPRTPVKRPCADILLKIANGAFNHKFGVPTVDSRSIPRNYLSLWYGK